jgi:hypothetical protein
MCEYCEQRNKWGEGKDILSEVCIINGLQLSATCYGCEEVANINYCFMCGRKLREET